MLRTALRTARPLARAQPALTQVRMASASLGGSTPTVTLSPAGAGETFDASETDPKMNGNYPDQPRIKRSLRDPYDNWWDPQERRNYNEPLHEDNDVLGVFSTEPYRHFTPAWGWVLVGGFVATTLTLCTIVGINYPDKGSVPRTFPDGLEKELGGPGALRARTTGEDKP